MILLILCLNIFAKYCVSEDNAMESFEKFKIDFNKSYNTTSEHNLREEIFLKNLETMKRHNENSSNLFQMGINQFSDMTFKELYILNYIDEDDLSIKFDLSKYTLPDVLSFGDENFTMQPPDSFDWRDRGVVSKVKDQKLCGACYAFTTLDALESQMSIKYGKSLEFSKQEIIDCAQQHGTNDCGGGTPIGVYSYINEKGGISLEQNYPYQSRKTQCNETIPRINITIPKLATNENRDEELLKKLLFNMGPVSIMMDHLHESFFFYKTGIYYEPECINLEIESHVILLIGYGSENGNDFWIIKNSYSTSWGEEGYMRIARNRNNHCNIGMFSVIPLL